MDSSARSQKARLDYDVVVVGGCFSAPATAMLLARAGIRVGLVDRPVGEIDALSAHALLRAGVIQLHRWGLLDQVIAAGTPAVRHTLFRYGEATTAVSLRRVAGVDALYAPLTSVLGPILMQAAGAAGAELIYGISVTDVERAPDGRVIGVVGEDNRREPVRLRASVTIGADGRHSTVAGAVGATVERRASHASSFIYGYVPSFHTDGYEWLYAPGVTAALMPTNNHLTWVSVGAPSERFGSELAADIPGSFRRLLAEASPELAQRVAAAVAPSRLRSFRGAPGFLRRPWGPGWALVGDAGYYKDPITAHGISDALRDAELLADATTAFLGGELTEAAAMGEYHRTRNRLSLRLFEVTDALASYRWDTRSVEAHLRCLSAAMVDEVDYLLTCGSGAPSRPVGGRGASAHGRETLTSGVYGASEGQR